MKKVAKEQKNKTRESLEKIMKLIQKLTKKKKYSRPSSFGRCGTPDMEGQL